MGLDATGRSDRRAGLLERHQQLLYLSFLFADFAALTEAGGEVAAGEQKDDEARRASTAMRLRARGAAWTGAMTGLQRRCDYRGTVGGLQPVRRALIAVGRVARQRFHDDCVRSPAIRRWRSVFSAARRRRRFEIDGVGARAADQEVEDDAERVDIGAGLSVWRRAVRTG